MLYMVLHDNITKVLTLVLLPVGKRDRFLSRQAVAHVKK
jgi:hypothetical protein